MPLDLYIHTPMPNDMNERRAVSRMARLLHRRYLYSDAHLLLVANINPDFSAVLRERGLPQLDGLLLGPEFVALLEFKNYFDPIIAPTLDGAWYAQGSKRRQPVVGGSRKNPYLQAKNSRTAWLSYFQELTMNLLSPARRHNLRTAWYHLSVFLLFHPMLHPESKLPPLGREGYWLNIRGLDDVVELAYAVRSPQLQLTLDERKLLVEQGLGARPWQKISSLLYDTVGHVYVKEPGEAPVAYPVQPFDDFTIGRASAQGHRVILENEKISRVHARVEVLTAGIRLYDLDSTNGTFVNGRLLTRDDGATLLDGQVAYLGGNSADLCQIWFEKQVSTSKPADSTAIHS